MKPFLHLLLVPFLFFAACNAAPTSLVAPTATVDTGALIGVATSLSGTNVTVNKFLGVPFAASPTRFAPAVRPTAWQSPYDATKYGPACIQQFNYPEAARNMSIAFYDTPPPPAGESEDCLNLNVWVPETAEKNKTVMVWIYVRFRLPCVMDPILRKLI